MAEEERLHQQPEGRETPRSRRVAAASKPRVHAAQDYRDERELREEDEEDAHLDDLSDDERFLSFVDSQNQTVLPDLPKMPGYHTCWLTTANARDSIPNRMRWGYELIRPEMLPGWEKSNLRTGEYGEVIMVNEMVAARISFPLYKRMMKHLHHDLPLADEEKLRARTEQAKEDAARAGSMIQVGDGMTDLVHRTKDPTFA